MDTIEKLRSAQRDIDRLIKTLLQDEEWSRWSDREIARHAEVSNGFVSKLRRGLTVNNTQSNIRKGADGRTIDTTNIGSKAVAAILGCTPERVSWLKKEGRLASYRYSDVTNYIKTH